MLDRSGYRCHYCKRSPEDILAETGGVRGLRLVVDHCVPLRKRDRKKIMAEFADLRFRNCVCACWVCNTIKAHWPQRAFEEELRSLARAVLQPTR